MSLFQAGLCLLAFTGCGFPPPADLPGDGASGPGNDAAVGDASSGDDAGGDADPGNDAGSDAAPGSDAGVDGPPANPRGTVRVTVVDPAGGGAPAVGVTVVFIDPDGTVVKTASSDSSGKTDAEVLPGASITTVITSTAGFRMRTMLGVQPGDDLVIGPRVVDTRIGGMFRLDWPDAPNHATTFTVYGPCGNVGTTTFVPGTGSTAPTTLTFGVQNGCRPDPTEFLVWARGQQGLSLHFNVNGNIPFGVGRNFTMSNQWNGGISFGASYTNVSAIATITTDRIVPDGGRSEPVSKPATNPTTFAFSGPPGGSARVVSRFAASSGADQFVRQKVPGTSSTYNMNVAETLLAWLAAPTFDAARQQFSVVKTIAGSDPAPVPDLFRIEAAWERGTTQYLWEVFGPDATTVQLPVLPAAAGAALNPTASDALRMFAVAYEADTFADYAAVRSNAGVALSGTFEPSRSAAERVRVSESPPPPPPPSE